MLRRGEGVASLHRMEVTTKLRADCEEQKHCSLPYDGRFIFDTSLFAQNLHVEPYFGARVEGTGNDS